MEELRVMTGKWIGVLVLLSTIIVGDVLLGQTPQVVVDQAYGGDANVTGQGVPGSVPLTVFSMVGASRNFLGSSMSIDQQGYYAVAVNPVLVNGQQIIVVDSQGRSSAVVTVMAKSGPAVPSN
jgi:hypothetical protein